MVNSSCLWRQPEFQPFLGTNQICKGELFPFQHLPITLLQFGFFRKIRSHLKAENSACEAGLDLYFLPFWLK